MKNNKTKNKKRKKKKNCSFSIVAEVKGPPTYKRDYEKNKKSIPKSYGKWKERTKHALVQPK